MEPSATSMSHVLAPEVALIVAQEEDDLEPTLKGYLSAVLDGSSWAFSASGLLNYASSNQQGFLYNDRLT